MNKGSGAGQHPCVVVRHHPSHNLCIIHRRCGRLFRCGHPSSLPRCVIVVHLSPSLLHGRSSLWSSVAVVVIRRRCHIVSSCPPVSIVVVWPLFCVVVNAKGEGEGVTWQWLGALQWLFVVAVVVGVCERLMTLVGGGGCRW